MEAKLSPPEPDQACAHPGNCGHETAGTEGVAGNPAGALSETRNHEPGRHAGAFKRWVIWFLAFFGIYASSSMCPFCGTPGCPVGIGGAALVGGVFASLWQYGKSAWKKLRG